MRPNPRHKPDLARKKIMWCNRVCLSKKTLLSILSSLCCARQFTSPFSVTSPRQVSKGSKAGGGKGGGKRPNALVVSSSAGGAAGVGCSASASSVLAEAHRLKNDEAERRRTDPLTDLHLWTFRRKNPLADGGVLPVDEPEWPGPLKEVRMGPEGKGSCVLGCGFCGGVGVSVFVVVADSVILLLLRWWLWWW